MATLADLKAELDKEKKEFAENEERKKVERELKGYKFAKKHPNIVAFGRAITKTGDVVKQGVVKVKKAYVEQERQSTKRAKKSQIDWDAYYKRGSLFG